MLEADGLIRASSSRAHQPDFIGIRRQVLSMHTKRRLQLLFVTSLTIGRIPLILVFLFVNLFLGGAKEYPLWFSIAFGAMVLSALTDLFDGYFARKFNMVSKLGGYADPLTDKIFYLTVFPTLIFRACLRGEPFAHSSFLVAFAVFFLMRDQWVTFLRSIGALYDYEGKANWSGKARTLLTFPTLCCIYWYLQAPPAWWLQVPAWLVYILEAACIVITIVSGWVYTRYYWPCLRKEMLIPLERDKDAEQNSDR